MQRNCRHCITELLRGSRLVYWVVVLECVLQQCEQMLRMRSTLLLLLLFTAITCYSQINDPEVEHQKQETQEAFSRLLIEIGDKLSDSTLTTEQQYELFDPMVVRANDKRSTFMEIRRSYLLETLPPPETFAGLPFGELADNSMTLMMEDAKFMTLTLMQCYSPIELAGMVASFVLPAIFREAGLGWSDASISYIFGKQVFAQNVQGDEWCLWYANRAFLVRFNLNLGDMTVNNVSYTLPNAPEYLKLQLPFTSYTQRFEVDRLYHEMDGIRWDAYALEQVRESTPHEWQELVNGQVVKFYTENQLRFVNVQTELLDGLERGIMPDTDWDEVTSFTAEEYGLLNGVAQPYVVQPDELAYLLFSMTNSMAPFNQDLDDMGRNAFVGFRHYTLDEKEGTWQVLSIGHSIAFVYSWDVKTGTFPELKVFKRKHQMADQH